MNRIACLMVGLMLMVTICACNDRSKPVELKKTDPVMTGPVVDEPVREESREEAPIAEVVVVEKPVVEVSVVEAPVTEEPVTEEPVVEKPVEDSLVISDVLLGFVSIDEDLTLEKLQELNAQYQDHVVVAPLDNLSDDLLKSLQHIVMAADIMDDLFWMQTSDDAMTWRSYYDDWPDPLNEWDTAFKRYLTINVGIYDRLRDFEPFMGDSVKPLGANYYPGDVTKEKVNKWVAELTDPDLKAQAESVYTAFRYNGDTQDLIVVPYAELYRTRLARAAEHLRTAAELADSPSLKKFLLSRAEAFHTNEYKESDADWVNVEGSLIDVTIGPYEVYEDRLRGAKGAFEAFIGVIDPVLSADLGKVKSFLPELDSALPLADEHRGYERSEGSPIFVIDVVLTSGDTLAGVQTSAFNLPNDEDVRGKVGSKKVLLRNIMEGKFKYSLVPISKVVLDADQQDLVVWDCYFHHALLHELAHGIGPGKITLNGEKTTVGKALQELYPLIEELKADVVGFWAVSFLLDKGFYTDKSRLERVAATSLAGVFRGLGFGIEEAHGKSAMMFYNTMMENGAFIYDEETGNHQVVLEKFQSSLVTILSEVLVIEATGDYEAAKAFIEKYGSMPESAANTMAKLTDIPVDIHPVYETAQKLRNWTWPE